MGGRKTRSDSKLGLLPETTQRDLWGYIHAPGNTYEDAVSWLLKEHSVESSAAALSYWRAKRSLKEEVGELESEAKAIAELVADLPGQSLNHKQIEELGTSIFLNRGIRSDDAKMFAAIARVSQRREQLTLDDRKLAILEAKAAKLDELEGVVTDKALTPEQRERKIKEAFGLG